MRFLAKKLFALLLPVLPWVAGFLAITGVVLIILLAFYAVVPAQDLNADNKIDQVDAALKQKYVEQAKKYSGKIRDYYRKELDHRLEWGLLYAVDAWAHELAVSRALKEGKKPPEARFRGDVVAPELAPRFAYKPSTVTIETTVCSTDAEGNTTCETTTEVIEIELLTRADTYRGLFTYAYEWVTETYHPGENTTVTVTKEVLKSTKYEKDYRRFDAVLARELGVPPEEVTPEVREMVLQMGYGATQERENLAWLLASPVYGGGAVLAEIAPEYLELFKKAGEAYGVPWYLLAAIAKVESNFRPDAVGPPNYTGELALGMMQFLPSTWEQFGVDADGDGRKDPFDPADAVYSAARYLAHLGVAEDVRKALYGYNHSSDYVEKVLEIAEGYRIQELYGGPGYTFPVAAGSWRISSPFGAWESFRQEPHDGVDIAVPVGTPVLAVIDGVVERLSFGWPGGRELYLRGADGNLYYYAHLDGYAPGMQEGAQVNSGTVLGYVGMTGHTTGPHLHFGVMVNGRWVDPMLIFRGEK
jgi:hypothetical protein